MESLHCIPSFWCMCMCVCTSNINAFFFHLLLLCSLFIWKCNCEWVVFCAWNVLTSIEVHQVFHHRAISSSLTVKPILFLLMNVYYCCRQTNEKKIKQNKEKLLTACLTNNAPHFIQLFIEHDSIMADSNRRRD